MSNQELKRIELIEDDMLIMQGLQLLIDKLDQNLKCIKSKTNVDDHDGHLKEYYVATKKRCVELSNRKRERIKKSTEDKWKTLDHQATEPIV